MKKLFLVLAIAGVLAACNNGGGEEVKPDTTAAPATGDTTVKPVDTTAKPVDTSAAKK